MCGLQLEARALQFFLDVRRALHRGFLGFPDLLEVCELALEPFELRLDTAFDRVIERCASVPRPGQAGTWITTEMIDAYCALHEEGFAHSAEAWRDGELVGGLYGISLGAAFFGESMFAWESNASKLAFVTLVRQLRDWGFLLVDCQQHTEHLARFGATDWSRARFLDALAEALETPTRRGAWRLGDEAPAQRAKIRSQAVVEFEIRRDPDRRDGDIARAARCSVMAVSKARKRLGIKRAV